MVGSLWGSGSSRMSRFCNHSLGTTPCLPYAASPLLSVLSGGESKFQEQLSTFE